MYATERQSEIENRLNADGRVSVVTLAREFDVTTETVRRDLAALEDRGVLRRVHGGAVAAGRASTTETAIGERGVVRGADKARIAARALSAIRQSFDGSIFIDAGSTTAALARLLPEHLRSVGGSAQIVTHSVPIAFELGVGADADVTIVGGRVRGLTAAAVGSATVAAIDDLRPDIAFVGTNGIAAGFGLSTPDPDEAAVKRAIVRAARRVVVLADASKVDETFLVRFARLDDIDVLVTDSALPDDLSEALRAADVEAWLS